MQWQARKKDLSPPWVYPQSGRWSPDKVKYAVVCTGQKYFGKSLLGSWSSGHMEVKSACVLAQTLSECQLGK